MFLGCLPEAPEAAQLMADQPPQVGLQGGTGGLKAVAWAQKWMG